DRRVAELLELFVASRQGTPELCPRITAVVLVWLIIFVPIMVHTATNTDSFSPLGMLIGTKEVTSEKNWCYLETSLYENSSDCCNNF
uniref:Uncharacterized protein n=1 Tax=Romanomermis culicivorax TaxID=13658 RepID=A0A915J856_ROMCU